MTTQIWVPQRFVVDPLTFTPPSSFNAIPTSRTAPLLIDLRPFVSGGRPPYTYILGNPVPPPLSFNKTRGLLYGANPAGGNFSMVVTVYDAFGSSVSATMSVILAIGPLTLTGAYPDVHSIIPYSYTLTCSGGVPPYRFGALAGVPPGPLPPIATPNLNGLIFDPSTSAWSGTPKWLLANAPANVWQIYVSDSATPPNSTSVGGSLGLYNA